MWPNGKYGTGERPENLFRNRSEEKLPEPRTSMGTDHHQIRVVPLDGGVQTGLNVAFLNDNQSSDSLERTEELLAVLVILRFRGFHVGHPAGRRERGVQERRLNVQRDKVRILVFGNLSDVRNGLCGGRGEIRRE